MNSFKTDIAENNTKFSLNFETDNRELFEEIQEFSGSILNDNKGSNYIKLPCKLGDTVYYLATSCDNCKEKDDYCHTNCKKPKGFTKINSTVIKQFMIQGNQFDSMTDTDNLYSSCAHYFHLRDINKTVFLTRKEAKIALNAIKN